jgi:hypothetical protein
MDAERAVAIRTQYQARPGRRVIVVTHLASLRGPNVPPRAAPGSTADHLRRSSSMPLTETPTGKRQTDRDPGALCTRRLGSALGGGGVT